MGPSPRYRDPSIDRPNWAASCQPHPFPPRHAKSFPERPTRLPKPDLVNPRRSDMPSHPHPARQVDSTHLLPSDYPCRPEPILAFPTIQSGPHLPDLPSPSAPDKPSQSQNHPCRQASPILTPCDKPRPALPCPALLTGHALPDNATYQPKPPPSDLPSPILPTSRPELIHPSQANPARRANPSQSA